MINRALTKVLTALVRGYQLIVSPWFAPTCRYYPSCSAYAIESLHVHGPFKGTALATWRLLRCNPWSDGGIDHVPPRGQWKGSAEVIDSGRSQTPEEDSSSTSQRVAETTAVSAPPAWRSLHGNI